MVMTGVVVTLVVVVVTPLQTILASNRLLRRIAKEIDHLRRSAGSCGGSSRASGRAA